MKKKQHERQVAAKRLTDNKLQAIVGGERTIAELIDAKECVCKPTNYQYICPIHG